MSATTYELIYREVIEWSRYYILFFSSDHILHIHSHVCNLLPLVDLTEKNLLLQTTSVR